MPEGRGELSEWLLAVLAHAHGAVPDLLPGQRPLNDEAARQRLRRAWGDDVCFSAGEPFERVLPRLDGLIVMADDVAARRAALSAFRERLADVDRDGSISLEELQQSPYGRTLQGAWGHPVPDVILDEVARVLVPGGRLLVGFKATEDEEVVVLEQDRC